jgi:RNA polymerase sigma factor (sigma-70 family)
VSRPERGVEDLLRDLAPRVLGAMVRRYGDFDFCEDAVQEALLAASLQWPEQGVPDNPAGWLVTVASRRWTERWRSETARAKREETAAVREPRDPEPVPDVDDTLTIMLLCCHPALTTVSQVALTLRAVGGLTTPEIARSLLVPEATVGQRISRAKKTIQNAGARFELPPEPEMGERITALLKVLYLIFNEGYTASSGAVLSRVELTGEAIRLTRQLHSQIPEHGEVAGLLSLMLLVDARRPARTGPDGALIPLAEQDRRRWDSAMIAEGTRLIVETLARAPIGPYQLQAAIAALHDEAERAEDTDWPQVLALYEHLEVIAGGPMVTLNRIVALAMVRGPEEGLRGLGHAEIDAALSEHHRVSAVRAHLLEMIGDESAARGEYELAARRTLSIPEQRYLRSRAARVTARDRRSPRSRPA